MKLTVYSIRAYGKYCMGMAIVAAENLNEATLLAQKSCSEFYSVRYNTPDNVKELPVEYKDEPMVLDHFESGE
jgi:hypothetical protein